MYSKSGKIKSYAGRLMWKRLPKDSQAKSEEMLFWDGAVWWIGVGRFRQLGDEAINAPTNDGWMTKDKIPTQSVTSTAIFSDDKECIAVHIDCQESEEVSGVYIRSGFENGKPRFEKGDGWFCCYSGTSWWISLDYYSNGNDTPTGEPPVFGWMCYAGQKGPPPKILLCTPAHRADLEELRNLSEGLTGSSGETPLNSGDATGGTR